MWETKLHFQLTVEESRARGKNPLSWFFIANNSTMNHERFNLNLPPKVAFLALKEWSTEQVFREELVVLTSKIICFLSL
jgi:hypothetical protein